MRTYTLSEAGRLLVEARALGAIMDTLRAGLAPTTVDVAYRRMSEAQAEGRLDDAAEHKAMGDMVIEAGGLYGAPTVERVAAYAEKMQAEIARLEALRARLGATLAEAMRAVIECQTEPECPL